MKPPPDDISSDNYKRIENLIKNRVKVIEPQSPQGFDQLLSSMSLNEPNNRRIVEIISTEKNVKRGKARFFQDDSEDMDEIIYGFENIPVVIKEKNEESD